MGEAKDFGWSVYILKIGPRKGDVKQALFELTLDEEFAESLAESTVDVVPPCPFRTRSYLDAVRAGGGDVGQEAVELKDKLFADSIIFGAHLPEKRARAMQQRLVKAGATVVVDRSYPREGSDCVWAW